MAGSTYSTNLKIELMTTGENSGTWGDITNTNLGTAFEQAVIGLGNPDYTSDANLTITITNSNASQAARCLVLNVTSAFGSLTATRELIVPTIQKQYIVQNNTTGGQSITVKTSAGTGITVPNGRKAHLYVNGTNVIQMFDFINVLGGTIDNATLGATTASSARVTTLNASGATTLDGTVALGNAAGDIITVPGTLGSNLIFTDNTYDIGASGATRPRNLFLAGAATVGGNLSVGGTLTLTGGVNLNGNVTVGDASTDTLTINSTITSNLIFTDNTYDIGASGATRPRNLFLAGNATIGGSQTLTGALTVDSTTDSTSTTTGSIQTDGGIGVAKAVYIGTNLTVNSLTATRVPYASTSGLLIDSANMTFSGTVLTVSGGVTLSTNAAKFQSTFGGVTNTNLFTDSGGGVLSVDGNNTISLRTGGISGTSVAVVASTGLTITGTASVSSTLFKPEGTFVQWNSTGASGGTNRGIVWADSSSNLYVGSGSGNSTVATFNATGLGVGASPSLKLTVYEPAANALRLIQDHGTSSAYGMEFYTQAGGTPYTVGTVLASHGGAYVNSYMVLQTANTSRVLQNAIYIDSSQNVSVGSGSGPSSKLDVNGAITLQSVALPTSGVARLYSRNTDANLYIQSSTGNTIYLLDGSQNTMYAAASTSHAWSISNVVKAGISSLGVPFVGSPSNTALAGWSGISAQQYGNSAYVFGDGQFYNWNAGISMNAYRSANAWYNVSGGSLPISKFEMGNGGTGVDAGFGWWWGGGSASAGQAANWTKFMTLNTSGTLIVSTATASIQKSGAVTSLSMSTGDAFSLSTSYGVLAMDSGGTALALRMYNGGYSTPFIFGTNGVLSVGGDAPTTSGAGIQFPATQQASSGANVLDDYEEGTWTPNVGGTATYTDQKGLYTKVGRVVTIIYDMTINVIGTGGTSFIQGIPFAPNNSLGDMARTGGPCVSWFTGLSSSVVYLGGGIDSTASVIYLASLTAAGTGLNPTATVLTSGTRVAGTLTYLTA